jgi:transposase InsO family protein
VCGEVNLPVARDGLDEARLTGGFAGLTIGTVGDAYDNAMAESFVDSFKTELIRDHVFKTRSQLELAIVEYVAWFNNVRLHESLGDLPPSEYETLSSSSTVDLSLS